jgi:KaiC/GvpD/RAD55 family RecA-like ATPase
MYVELTKGVNIDRGNIVEYTSVTNEARGHECYISHFPFDKSILDYVNIHNTIKDHKGKHFCPYILIDVDNETDLNESKARALEIITRLQSEYDLSPEDLSIYFSGNKGFHIVININSFGSPEPHEEMGLLIKLVVAELCGPLKYDVVIYENHRLMRVDNSLHGKSGLYKIQISYSELFSLTIEEIKALASRPRIFTRKKPISEIRLNEKINRIVRSVFLKTDEPEKKTIDEGFFLPGPRGDRNNKLYKQAYYLFINTDLHEKSIKELITSINNSAPDPLPLSEINTLVNSARSNRKHKDKEPLKISTFADMWQSFVESLNEENNKVYMVFKGLDNLFKGKQRGKLGIILGYGGSKKSLYGQNICFQNVKDNRCIYSNMEMGTATLAERFINICMTGGARLATDLLEARYKGGLEIESALQSMKEMLTDHLIVSENSNMTSGRYDELIEKVTKERGRVDILIVDGMSMMGGTGTEVERANEHSKGLKELAKKWNIFVLAICHVSKGDDLITRDLTRKARGSEKIVDNADWIMTLSQIKQGGDYLSNSGVYHVWDKRGTGLRKEQAWKFRDHSLRMEESDEDISKFTETFEQ